MKSRTLRDTSGVAHAVITAIVDDTVVFIISNDAFSIDNTDAENTIPGFDVVKQGTTMVNTQASTLGVTSDGHVYWGTARSAQGLVVGGAFVSADSFVQSGTANFSTLVEFADVGFAVGDSNDLRVFIDNDNEAYINNEVGTKILFSAKSLSGTLTNPFIMESNSIVPGYADIAGQTGIETVTLGSATRAFDNVYADNFTGLSEKASTLVVGGNNRSGDINAVNNTVAVRTSTGDLKANLFIGVATQAKYADLAEKYTTNKEYPTGTAMAICSHDGHEAEAASAKDICIGVISAEPAYLMNSEADGQAIALKGRVPVRVKGPVSKGMPVYAWEDGVCTTIGTQKMVGVALETNNSEEEKLVECILTV